MRLAMDGSLALGGLLVLIVLLLLALPCEYGLCDRPQPRPARAAQGAPLEAAPHDAGASIHCVLHCGVYLLPLLLIVVTPPATTTLLTAVSRARLRLSAPPPLPPPQLA